MGLIGNKFAHSLLGLCVAVIALVPYFLGWGDGVARWILLGVGGLGLLHNAIIGHNTVLLLIIILPFALGQYALLPPLRRRKDGIYHEDKKVIAYRLLPDRLLAVSHGPGSWSGGSIFRGRRTLQRMHELLQSAGVPQVPSNEETLARAVEHWNRDEALRTQLERDSAGPAKSGAPLIVLDADSRAALDRVAHVMRLVGRSKQVPPEWMIQLALWYTLAGDRFYGREDWGLLDRLMLE